MTAALGADETPGRLSGDRMSQEEFLAVRNYVRVNGFRDPTYFQRCRWRMSPNQRAIIAADLALRRRGNNSRNPKDLPPTRLEVERTCAISVGSLDRAKVLVRYGTEDLLLLTAADHVALTTASRIARLPQEMQEGFVTRVRDGMNPRTAAKPGAWEGIPREQVISTREARYLYVQEPAMRVMADSFDALATVLSTSRSGLDPAITAEQAATWHGDLSRRARSFRRLMGLLKQRQEDSLTDDHD